VKGRAVETHAPGRTESSRTSRAEHGEGGSAKVFRFFEQVDLYFEGAAALTDHPRGLLELVD
jgi:hypothetical protein